MIVGTAGHIDHGKTTLVKALTGVDCDRLKEEKARGITVDLPQPGEHLAHRNVLRARGVAAGPLVVFSHVEQDRRRVELGGQLIDVNLWHVHIVHAYMLARAACARPQHAMTAIGELSTVSTGLSTANLRSCTACGLGRYPLRPDSIVDNGGSAGPAINTPRGS